MTKPRPDGMQNSDIFIDLRRTAADRKAGARALHSHAIQDAAFETVRARKGRKPIWIDLRMISLDGMYAFVLFAAMLFVAEAGSAAGLAMAVLPLAYTALRRRRIGQMLGRCWPLFAIPAVALASAIWSEAPGVSAKYAGEMWLTALAGVSLAGAQRPTAMLKGVCLAFALYILAALGLGHSVAVGANGGEAFSGFGDSKNLLADIAATGLLISLATLAISVRQRQAPWWAFALCAAAAEAFVAVMARSAGALLAAGVAVAVLGGLCLLATAPRAARATFVGVLIACGAVLAANLQALAAALLGAGASMFDKDPTLTGRTYLWYRAHDLMAEKPWLGHGFQAFWRQGNTDAEGLWQYAGIAERAGFNFHNSLIEVVVQLGWIGAAIYGLALLIGLIGLVRHFVAQPTVMVCLWIAYITYLGVRVPFEVFGYPFYFSTVLLFAAAGSGLARLPRRLKVRRAYQPQAARLQHFYAAQQARAAAARAFASPAE